MEEDLWGAAKAEISIPMPEQHDHERGMSQQRLSDMAPGNDRAIFPGCVEEQVRALSRSNFPTKPCRQVFLQGVQGS